GLHDHPVSLHHHRRRTPVTLQARIVIGLPRPNERTHGARSWPGRAADQPFSAARFRSAAYFSKIGPKSGSDPAIIGSIRPEKTSTISKVVVRSSTLVRVNVRTPWNMGANPSRQTIRRPASNSLTLGLNVCFGAAGTRIASFCPRAMGPSMLVTVEFQVG